MAVNIEGCACISITIDAKKKFFIDRVFLQKKGFKKLFFIVVL